MPGHSERRSSRAQSLDTLVGIGARRFLEDYWPHRAHVHHGPLERFEHLIRAPELRDVDSILRAATSADRVRVWFTDKSGAFRDTAVSPEQASTLYQGGQVTAVIDGLRLPVLARWMTQLARELQTPMTGYQVNVYASSRNVGTRFHFDDAEVVLVQLRGQKTWRIAPNAQPSLGVEYFGRRTPLALLGSPAKALEPDPAKMKTHVLRPGSVMFLPRGYWHGSTTSGDDSLALTLTFNAFTWAKLLAAYVTNELWRDPAWREVAHGAAPLSGRRAKPDARFRELVAAAAARLGRLDLARCVESAVGIYSAVPPLRLRVAPRVRARASRSILRVETGPGAVVEIELGVAASRLWRAVRRRKGIFTPADVALPDVPPRVVGRFLDALLDVGILVVAR